VFVPPPEIQRLRMLTTGPDGYDVDNLLRARIMERHLPVTTRPPSGQDRQTQPLMLAPSRVAEQNRAAIASWLAGSCGHTTHASSAAWSRDDACSRSRTSAEVGMEMSNVEAVMAELA
jgi:hypothetical protein